MNSLPSEIIHYIFEYLPPKDLVQAGATCKRFYKIAQSENLPARLQIPKLNPKIVQENALILWNYPEENFTVDAEGRLVHIASYHLIARFSKWCDKDVTVKVNRIVEITFQEIYRLNQQGYIPKRAQPSKTVSICPPPFQPMSAESICPPPRRLYVWDPNWFYSQYHPADYLADKILNSKQFAEPKIRKAALLVKGQADMYDKIRKKYGLSDNAPDERVAWYDTGIDEAFFCKNFK